MRANCVIGSRLYRKLLIDDVIVLLRNGPNAVSLSNESKTENN